MHDYRIEDDGTLVEIVDPTGKGCGCVIRHYPDGSWTDSGCFRHMPHESDEGPPKPWDPSDPLDPGYPW
jgi:hypothetical protein